jgi:glutathione synthase/RimK-type ligase-like ATP-grasp enzyme
MLRRIKKKIRAQRREKAIEERRNNKEIIKAKFLEIAAKEETTPEDRKYVYDSFKYLESTAKKKRLYEGLDAKIREMMETYMSEESLADEKYSDRIYKDILFCNRIYGFSPQEYFTYDLEKLSHAGRKTFVTTRNKRAFYRELNNQNYIMYLNKKTEMYKKFKDYYGRDAFALYDEDDREGFREFVRKHPRFIYKPSDDYGGKGIKIINSYRTTGADDLFDILIAQGSGIVEELIVQGEELAQFHPKSVNTVRAVTFLNSDNEPEIQWCFLRMGMGENRTDNASGGGLSAMIDPETGTIISVGRNWKGETHIVHPDTGVPLIGFRMPEWDKAKELLKKVSNVLPQLRLVGWDLAYSENGWILIEGNSRPQCVSPQIPAYNGKFHCLEYMRNTLEAEKKVTEE